MTDLLDYAREGQRWRIITEDDPVEDDPYGEAAQMVADSGELVTHRLLAQALHVAGIPDPDYRAVFVVCARLREMRPEVMT